MDNHIIVIVNIVQLWLVLKIENNVQIASSVSNILWIKPMSVIKYVYKIIVKISVF